MKIEKSQIFEFSDFPMNFQIDSEIRKVFKLSEMFRKSSKFWKRNFEKSYQI